MKKNMVFVLGVLAVAAALFFLARPGGAGGAAFLGGALYFRDDGVRDGFLFRVQSAVCLLSEPSYCGNGERKSDFDRAAFGYFSGAAGAECE